MKTVFHKIMLILSVLLSGLWSNAMTSTFTYTASHRIDRFDEYEYFAGADSVISHTFNDATGTGTVVYEGTVTELKTYALQWNSDLTSIVIPEGVTTIGVQAFYACSKLSSIGLPKSLKLVRNLAFDGTTGFANGKFIIDDIAWWCGITFESVFATPLHYAKHIYSDENTEITHLVIPNGVPSIGSNAFINCEGITAVTFPESLTTIGSGAFKGCSSLESVDIPVGMTEISASAFENCTKLERITIPEGVTKIGSSSFAHTGIRTLTLPSTITSMASSFYNCDSLVSLTLTEGITTINGSFSSCHALTEVHIPSSIKRMGESDFSSCTSLERVTIAEGVEKICGFASCEKLSSINIPSTATEVSSFNYCKSLKVINMPKSVTTFSGFRDCFGLEKIIIEDLASWCNMLFSSTKTYNAQYYAKHLYLGTLNDHQEITDLVIPEGVTQIKRYAFNNCESIATVTLPSTLTSLDNTAFSDCKEVTDVYALCDPIAMSWGGQGFKDEKATLMHVADTSMWKSRFPSANVTFVGDLSTFTYTATAQVTSFDNINAFVGASRLISHRYDPQTGVGTVVYVGPVTGLAANAFAANAALTSIIVPEGVTTIGTHAFHGCTGLAAVTLPSSVTTFDNGAFEGVAALADVYCSADSEMLSWGDSDNTQAFMPAKATRFNVTDAAAWMTKFPTANVTFDAGMTMFVYTATSQVTDFHKLEKFTGATALASHTYDEASGHGTVIYNGRVTDIVYEAFRLNKQLTEITIPATVTSIGQSAFDQCSNLTAVALPESLETVGSYLFDKCENLTTVNIPSNLSSLSRYMFGQCTMLANIDIPNGVAEICEYAFYKCTALTEVYIPQSVTRLGYGAFDQCTSMTKAITPSLETWCNINFENGSASPVSNTQRLFVGDKENNQEVTGNIEMPEGFTEIKQWVFHNMTGITSVVIPASITYIGKGAFMNCSGITEINFPESVTSIKYQALSNCTGLKTVTLPSTLTNIDSGTFTGSNDIDNIYCNADISHLYFGDGSNANAFKPNKGTLFHVPEKFIWKEKYPNANLRFVDGIPIFGDINDDGLVDVNDVVILADIAMGGSSEGIDLSVADIDGNGIIDVNDVVTLAGMVMGN